MNNPDLQLKNVITVIRLYVFMRVLRVNRQHAGVPEPG